jgi:hypothetical protein
LEAKKYRHDFFMIEAGAGDKFSVSESHFSKRSKT